MGFEEGRFFGRAEAPVEGIALAEREAELFFELHADAGAVVPFRNKGFGAPEGGERHGFPPNDGGDRVEDGGGEEERPLEGEHRPEPPDFGEATGDESAGEEEKGGGGEANDRVGGQTRTFVSCLHESLVGGGLWCGASLGGEKFFPILRGIGGGAHGTDEEQSEEQDRGLFAQREWEKGVGDESEKHGSEDAGRDADDYIEPAQAASWDGLRLLQFSHRGYRRGLIVARGDTLGCGGRGEGGANFADGVAGEKGLPGPEGETAKLLDCRLALEKFPHVSQGTEGLELTRLEAGTMRAPSGGHFGAVEAEDFGELLETDAAEFAGLWPRPGEKVAADRDAAVDAESGVGGVEGGEGASVFVAGRSEDNIVQGVNGDFDVGGNDGVHEKGEGAASGAVHLVDGPAKFVIESSEYLGGTSAGAQFNCQRRRGGQYGQLPSFEEVFFPERFKSVVEQKTCFGAIRLANN